jgi:hypothetical protein
MAGYWQRTQSRQQWRGHSAVTSIQEKEATGMRTKLVNWPRSWWMTAVVTMVPSGEWSWCIKDFEFNQTTLASGICKTEAGAKAATKREVKKICATRGIKL